MPTLESLYKLLNEASSILNEAAHEIKDIPLEPKPENIMHIADALGSILDIKLKIHERNPEITVTNLREQPKDDNRDFEHTAMFAEELVEQGKYEHAITVLQSFLRKERPDSLRNRANEIIKKYKTQGGI